MACNIREMRARDKPLAPRVLVNINFCRTCSTLCSTQYATVNSSFTPRVSYESIMETCSVVLTFESVDEILWCDHSNETSLAVLLHGCIRY